MDLCGFALIYFQAYMRVRVHVLVRHAHMHMCQCAHTHLQMLRFIRHFGAHPRIALMPKTVYNSLSDM